MGNIYITKNCEIPQSTRIIVCGIINFIYNKYNSITTFARLA